jgi:hypothetical protein
MTSQVGHTDMFWTNKNASQGSHRTRNLQENRFFQGAGAVLWYQDQKFDRSEQRNIVLWQSLPHIGFM